jgi:CubicO group peptidase (beta-lactamase class C family)
MFARVSPSALAAEFLKLSQQHDVKHAVLYRSANASAAQVVTTPGTKPDALFLLASITKPMTAVALMKLVDAGSVRPDETAKHYLPEMAGGAHAKITVRHLLTHTSGLPDMLPENDALRERHAPLEEFVKLAARTPLLFAPGAECRYQSMGILLAAAIVERLAGRPLPQFLEKEVFAPLGMSGTSLGLGGRSLSATVPTQLSGKSSWDWNSPYWRGLASPWGGAIAPASDIAKFLTAFLQPERQKVLQAATARAMIQDQNTGLNKAWGIGWAVNARNEGGLFGRGCSRQAFGHGGSVGTLCWADPADGGVFVILTGKPAAESNKPLLHPLSNLAAS